MSKVSRLVETLIAYEMKAISNLPSWYVEVGSNVASSTVIGAKNFWENHKELTANTIETLSTELGEFWEALQDVMDIPESQQVDGEEFVGMVLDNIKSM